MIDTEKLLGRINDKGVILSEKSISNLGVVRRRLVDIDGMLKEKLVLAKVREGIRRQEEERLKRVKREDEIEEKDDDDRDIDTDSSKVKRKKPKPSGPGGILGPAGALLTGAGFAVVAQNLGFFRVATQVLKGVGTVALATFMGLATVVDTGYKIVSAVEAKTLQMFGERGLKTLKTFQKVFTTFVNVAVISAISAAGMRAFGFTRGRLFPKIKVKPKVKTPTPVDITDLRTKPPKKLEKILKKSKVRSRPKRLVGSELKKRIFEIRGKDFAFSEAQREASKNFSRTGTPLNLEERELIRPRRRVKKMQVGKTRVKVKPQNVIPDTRLPEISIGDMPGDLGSNPTLVRNFNAEVRRFNKAPINSSRKAAASARINQMLNSTGLFEDEMQDFFRGNKDIKRMRVLKGKSAGGFRGAPDYDNFFNFNKRAPFFDPENPRGSTFGGGFSDSFFDTKPKPLTSRQILSQQGSFNAPKIINQVTKNADNFTNVKSLSTLLEAFGGAPLVKATRQFLGNTVGRIPLLGDLIGLALDVFLFKEPIQRALFMAAGGALGGSIGAWLGGILGTAVPVVGNLAGAVVGGFLGGVGGDMLGGFLYDVLFAGKPGFPAGESQTPLEKGAKGVVKLGLSGGGLVPALLSMNNGGSVPDIAYSASYDKPGAGSVRFIPIFVPSEERDVESANVSGVVITKRKRSQSSLYAGGLIS